MTSPVPRPTRERELRPRQEINRYKISIGKTMDYCKQNSANIILLMHRHTNVALKFLTVRMPQEQIKRLAVYLLADVYLVNWSLHEQTGLVKTQHVSGL